MNLVLIGYRGCGKTTIGRLLAEALWMKFVDLDEELARQAGRPVAEVFSLLGPEEFGQIECVVLAELAGRDGQVIGFGGRTPLTAANVETLKSCGRGRFIWLEAEPAVLAARLAGRASPHFADTLAEVERLAAERESAYRAAADIVIDTTHLTPDQTVLQIARRV